MKQNTWRHSWLVMEVEAAGCAAVAEVVSARPLAADERLALNGKKRAAALRSPALRASRPTVADGLALEVSR
jgi:hypothetical protein